MCAVFENPELGWDLNLLAAWPQLEYALMQVLSMLHKAVKSDFPDCCPQKCDIAGELPIASMSHLKVLLLVRLFPESMN